MLSAEIHCVLITDVLGEAGRADRVYLRAHCHTDGVAVNQAHAAAYHRLFAVERLPGETEPGAQAVLVRRKHGAARMTGRAEVHNAAASRRQVRVGDAE